MDELKGECGVQYCHTEPTHFKEPAIAMIAPGNKAQLHWYCWHKDRTRHPLPSGVWALGCKKCVERFGSGTFKYPIRLLRDGRLDIRAVIFGE